MTDSTGGTSLSDTVEDASGEGAMLREVIAGLREPLKRISSKFHYDERGSELFEEITRLEEYYPTRTEHGLLVEHMPAWVAELEPRAIVELGAGNSEKTRVILDAVRDALGSGMYVPVDVSHDFLEESAARLRADYPALDIVPVVADMTATFQLPSEIASPTWIAFLGSTLGNFDSDESVGLLSRIRARMTEDDRFLLGVDLRPGPHKTAERIELAYNDAAGVTAAFSLNVLAVLNDEVGSDFDLAHFRHRSFYAAEEGRIETYLVSERAQTVSFPDGTTVDLDHGEQIRTEISCKYDRATVDSLFARSGLEVVRWVEDECGYYALVLGRVV